MSRKFYDVSIDYAKRMLITGSRYVYAWFGDEYGRRRICDSFDFRRAESSRAFITFQVTVRKWCAICKKFYKLGACPRCYARCEDCGEIILRSEATDIDGAPHCKSCYDSIDPTECSACGRHTTSAEEYDGLMYCSDCFSERYTTCYDCGDVFLNDQMTYEDGEYYCSDCRRERVHSWDYRPEVVFERPYHRSDVLHVGIELEMELGEQCEREVTQENTCGELIYYKHDGSLDDGVEMVSQPRTVEWYGNDKLRSMLNQYRQMGLKSHDTNTCGLHVHIDRRYYGNTEIEEAKLLIVFCKYWQKIVRFSRRRDESIEQWTKRPPVSLYENDDDDIMRNKTQTAKNCGRYHAVNLTNRNTIEIRIFRGTLRTRTFLAAIQFVQCVVDYCRRNDVKSIWCGQFDDMFKDCDCKYEELREYLRERMGITVEEKGGI